MFNDSIYIIICQAQLSTMSGISFAINFGKIFGISLSINTNGNKFKEGMHPISRNEDIIRVSQSMKKQVIAFWSINLTMFKGRCVRDV